MKTLQDFSPYNGLQWEPNGKKYMDILDDMGVSKLSAKKKKNFLKKFLLS